MTSNELRHCFFWLCCDSFFRYKDWAFPRTLQVYETHSVCNQMFLDDVNQGTSNVLVWSEVARKLMAFVWKYNHNCKNKISCCDSVCLFLKWRPLDSEHEKAIHFGWCHSAFLEFNASHRSLAHRVERRVGLRRHREMTRGASPAWIF